jgi:hypothetical protein
MRGFTFLVGALVACAALSASTAKAGTLYSDNFNTDTSANYNVYSTTGGSGATGVATFAFDYSTLGIPSAPNSLGDTSTLGLRVQSDQTSNTTSDLIGAVSVATKNLNLPSQYTVQVEVWGNYIGGTTINDANGSNGTTGPTIAAQVAGTTYDSATTNSAAQEGGVLTDAIRDATSSGGTYRVYLNGTNQGNTSGDEGIYAAASSNTDSTAAQYTNAYYTSKFPAVSAPTVQSTAASTQTGMTQPGVFGFAWHTVTLTNNGTNTIWSIDGNTIATIPDTSFTVGGSQISLGDQDSNTSMSSAGANGMLYNFDIFDDLVVTTPEPASLSLLALVGTGLIARRRV